jgi:L-alanine-DL-glutamate epimerase-like enolase superfamily enzyme
LLEGLRALDAHVPSSEPAARHALETALVDLSSRKRNEPFETTLVRAIEWPGEAGARRALTAWIGSALDPELAERAEAALSRGVRTLKVKIGTPEALEAEVLALQRLRRRLGPDALLRLDANQAFERAEAAILFRELAGLDIELLEEPLKAPLASSVSCSCPVALDESLAQVRSLHDVRPRLAELNVKAVVLKPMALGGLLRALTLSREANELGLDVIVSHLLDGPVALGAAASLSLAVGSVERAQGLELHAGLSAWPACDVATVTDTAVIGGARAGHGVEVPPS